MKPDNLKVVVNMRLYQRDVSLVKGWAAEDDVPWQNKLRRLIAMAVADEAKRRGKPKRRMVE